MTTLVVAAVCVIFLAQPTPVAAQSIVHVGSYDTLGFASGVIAQGNYAYVSDNILGLVIIDISNPAAPTAVGRYTPPLWIFDMKLHGDTIFLAAGSSEPYSGALYIVDVTNKQNPSLIGSVAFAWEALAVEVFVHEFTNWYYAYVSTYGGIRIVDFINPANPVVIGNFNVPGGAMDIEYYQGCLRIASGGSGLNIVTIVVPTNPVLEGTCDTPGNVYDVEVEQESGNLAFIADGDSGFIVIDTYNHFEPQIVGRVNTLDRAKALVIALDFAYVATEDSGFAIIYTRYPSRPSIFAMTDTPWRVEDICLAGENIAVVGGESIDIYRLETMECDYIPGDINGNGSPNGVDIAFAVEYFKGRIIPPDACDCRPDTPIYPFYAAGDVNGNCAFNGADIIYFVGYLRGQRHQLRYCPYCQPTD